MKTRIHIFCLAIGLLWLFPVSVVSVKADDDLDKSHSAYTNSIQTIRQDAEKKKCDLQVLYRNKLDALRQDAKQKGDFDAVQAVDKEIKRFEAQKAPPAVNNKSSGNELIRAGVDLHDELARSEVEHARQVVQWTEKYLQFLDGKVKQSVQDEKMDLAAAYRREISTTRETPAYQSAKYVVAEKDPQPETTKPSGESKSPTPAASVHSDIPHLRVDPSGLYDATRIYEGLPPLTTTASPYRPVSVVDTGKAPPSSDLGVSLDGYIENNNAYQLRLKLRPKTSGATFQDLRVVVQYFGHNPNNNNKVEETRVFFTRIPIVTASNITCEMKLADMPLTYTYYDFFGKPYASDKKAAFGGVVVSVFSAEDTLLVQSASGASFKEFSKSTFELPPAWQSGNRPAPANPGHSHGPHVGHS